ncbi:MAG TPA: family 43 glycosylhydrolase [Limnochordia bacterium]|nr:family 43 glycosylhydrolase [Limnochordia bacterium]
MNSIEFETGLAALRKEVYHHPQIDIINEGFRPPSGKPADFCVIEHAGRHHFFYIERRLQEGTPFYPGNEIYFGHASTADFFAWEVHEPVLLIRPGTWEGAHVWAPFILRHEGRFVMAYTGVNEHISQDIGLAVSTDLFHWERLASNPISPAADKPWAFWRRNGIASCRDPHLFTHDGRIYMTYTANTKTGSSCIALCSTTDWTTWEDHGPILIGPNDGYQVTLYGGRPLGQLESSHLILRNGRWFLFIQGGLGDGDIRNWVFESDRMDHFDFDHKREFWRGAYTVEIVKHRGVRSLLACTGPIRFGEVDWSDPEPIGRFVDAVELRAWATP